MDNGSVAKITPPRTHGKLRAPLRGVESAVVSLSTPSWQRGTAPRPAVFLKREPE